MKKERLLREGDIVELRIGHDVYVKIPDHFIFSNKMGCFDLSETKITIGENKNGLKTEFMCGRWIVVGTSRGPELGRQSFFPNIHCVRCEMAQDWPHMHKMKVSFYQAGLFTAMIYPGDIEIVGRAEATWKEIKQSTAD